jgi:hypothetical protein
MKTNGYIFGEAPANISPGRWAAGQFLFHRISNLYTFVVLYTISEFILGKEKD